MMEYLRFIIFSLLTMRLLCASPDDINRRKGRVHGQVITCAYLVAKLGGRRGEDFGFYRDISRLRDDDTVRLIFADKIEEWGSPERAELMRQQIELSQLLDGYKTHSIDDLPQSEIYRARELQAKIKEALKKHGKGWVPRSPTRGLKEVEFHRGIVEGVVLDLSHIDSNPEGFAKLVRGNPEIHRYTLRNATPEGIRTFLNLPGIENLTHLAIEGGSFRLSDLTENGRLKNIKRLDLDGHGIGEEGIRAIAVSPHLKNLENLGRLTRYGIPNFEEQARAWLNNPSTPFKLRKEAYLELLEQGVMNFSDINSQFNRVEREAVWKTVLEQGRFQKWIGDEKFAGALNLYSIIPERLQPKFLSVYAERVSDPYQLARDIEKSFPTAYRVSDAYEFIEKLLAEKEFDKGDPEIKETPREDLRLLYFLRNVHQNRDAKGKVDLTAYHKQYEKEVAKISNRDIYKIAAKETGVALSANANPLSFEFRKVKGGAMELGSPAHEPGRYRDQENIRPVTVSPFEMAATQFTWEQFKPIQKIFNERASREGVKPYTATPPSNLNRPLPTSYKDAKLICKILNEFEDKRPPGVQKYKYDLPTEAQWEFAMRGGTRSAYPHGNSIPKLSQYGVYNQTESQPIAQLKPNALGFYDMSGNMWEWGRDVYTADTTKISGADPYYDGEGSFCVLRGGSWGSALPQVLRSASRDWIDPDNRYYDFGFRLSRTPVP